MADIDFIETGDLQIAVPVEKLIPTEDPSRRVEPMGTINGDDLQIFLREHTLREIVAYSKSDTSRELGGGLPGRFYQWRGRLWIEIVGYIRATSYQNTAASFKFTHDSFSAMQRENERKFSDVGFVGWHHTHPGYGIFLSGMDRFIQNHFFNLPYQVALVVDPKADTLGFFQWKHRQIMACGFHYIYDATTRR